MASYFLILFFLASTLRATAQTDQPLGLPAPKSPHAIGHKIPSKNIPNFGEVTLNLYRGGQPTLKGLEDLKKIGVDIVVDLRGGRQQTENVAADKLGIRYISIPSHCPFPTDNPWAQFLAVVRDNPGRKIFVHCRLGDDRTGLAVASYRMADEGWSADEAMKEMQTFGFTAVHHAMCPGLEEYVESFPKRFKHNDAFKELRKDAGDPK